MKRIVLFLVTNLAVVLVLSLVLRLLGLDRVGSRVVTDPRIPKRLGRLRLRRLNVARPA